MQITLLNAEINFHGEQEISQSITLQSNKIQAIRSGDVFFSVLLKYQDIATGQINK